MSANFESGFFVREPAWHGLGKVVSEAPTTAEALHLAGLDWRVTKEPCYDKRNRVVDDLWLVTRDRDNAVLGHVGNVYKPVQPVEALDFMDALMGEGLVLDTAGSLHGGRRIWIMAKAPEVDILGDAYAPYMFISTSFDGSSNTEVGNTVTRIVCSNTLDMARHDAVRKWKCRHTSTIGDRIVEARRAMKLSGEYVGAIARKADAYARRRITPVEFNMVVNEMFGVEDMMTPRQKANTATLKSQLGIALRRPDLDNFKGTAWHLYNAVGDFATHIDPVRKTAEWRENLWESFMDGNDMLSTAERVLDELVA